MMGVASRTGSGYPFRIHEFTQIFSSIAQSLVYVVFVDHCLSYCVSIFDLHLLITPLVSCGYCIVCPSLSYVF
jgi:hypothetical protein